MYLRIYCVKGPSYFKQRDGYELKLKKMKMQIRDLSKQAKKTCNPNLELSKQHECEVAIANLYHVIMKKNELIKEFELFEEDWKEQNFDEE